VIIKMENVTKIYRRGREEVHALNGLSLQVEKGEFVGVLGPSGSGKSTLLNLLGLLDSPTKGKITIDGHSVEKLKLQQMDSLRRKTVGLVFQQFLLVPTMGALQNVMLPMYFSGRKDAAAKAARLLKRVGLNERLHHLPSEMSGGEIQRVAIARALANDPEILLADEPTGNLDSKTARDIYALFMEINQAGTTIILVTHNLELADLLPRTITLVDGRMTSDVKKDAVSA